MWPGNCLFNTVHYESHCSILDGVTWKHIVHCAVKIAPPHWIVWLGSILSCSLHWVESTPCLPYSTSPNLSTLMHCTFNTLLCTTYWSKNWKLPSSSRCLPNYEATSPTCFPSQIKMFLPLHQNNAMLSWAMLYTAAVCVQHCTIYRLSNEN